MLIEHPHDLCRVHCGAAAKGDDGVRLKFAHGCGAVLRGEQRGVGLNVGKYRAGDVHLVELVGDRLGVAVLVQEGVGNDKGFLFAHDVLQLLQGKGHAALLDIDLFRRSEPQHVLSPLGNGFDVQQVLHADVLAHGVAAPGAAAQRQRGREVEVVEVADAAVGGGRVDNDAAGLHGRRKFAELFALVHRVEIDGGGVAVAAVGDQLRSLCQRVVKGVEFIHSQHGAELFVGKFLADVNGFHLADQHLGCLGNVHAGELGDGDGLLTDDPRVQRAVDDDGLAHLFGLLGIEKIAAARLEFRFYLVIDLVADDHALLGGADHAVVKGLGMDDGVDGEQNVGGFVDDRRRVACADAERRLAARIGSLDHAGAAGGKDAVSLLHQHVGQLERRHVDPADDVFGSACRDSRLQHDTRRLDGALFGARMRAENDAVACFQAQQRLEDRRGGGVGGRNDGSDNAQGLRDLLCAVNLVLLNDAAGLDILVCVVNVLGSKVIFDDLILGNAHAGLFHCHLGERDSGAVGGGGSGKENPVYLLLCERGIRSLCGSHSFQSRLKALCALHNRILFVAHRIYLLIMG